LENFTVTVSVGNHVLKVTSGHVTFDVVCQG